MNDNSVENETDLDDPYLWLEEVDGAAANEWVERHNRTTLELLEARPDFQVRFARNLAILNHPDRIAWPTIRGDHVYNFWQDEAHERGLLRRMPLEAWLAGERTWRTLLDVDALAAAEGVNWVFAGSDWLEPACERALVALTRGGGDATVIREFDAATGSFVDDGFAIAEAKTHVAWIDRDTVHVGTSLAPAPVTTSGYARTIRRWTRGTRLEDAPVVFESAETDVGLFVDGARSAGRSRTIVYRHIASLETELHLLDGDAAVRIDVPLDADAVVLDDRVVVLLRGRWSTGGEEWGPESVIEIGIDEVLAGSRSFREIVRVEPRSAVVDIVATCDALVVTILRNVSAELHRFRFADGRWQGERIDVPANGSIPWSHASPDWDGALFMYTSFLQPPTLYALPAGGSPTIVQSQPEQYDASGLVVERREATSADGTAISYFLVRRDDIVLDGTTPTILYGYGGFDAKQFPAYSGTTGSGWLEGGGAFALANIRGGGEFGKAWHQAALRGNRQRAFDDFIAVAEDLIASGVTSSRNLGVMGGSNGGLLVGAVVTQRPELFGAAVAMVPVLDMRRYHVLHAGASWMGEYGNPDDPSDWEFLSAYSPYHNISPDVRYPRIFLTTSKRDDRVHPAHARKMAARLEELGHEVFFFENVEGGHAGAAGMRQTARQLALVHTYFAMALRR